MNNILAIAVHPDDETLGCGGTLLRHKDEGSRINWLIVTSIYTHENGAIKTVTSEGNEKKWKYEFRPPLCFSRNKVEERALEIRHVAKEYGFDSIYELCLPAMCLDQIPLEHIISHISNVMCTVMPDTVILPFGNDVHSDHRITFDTAYSCTKSFRYPFIQKIMMMEIISETDFVPLAQKNIFCPNLFVDITNYIEKKIEIMSLYKGETSAHPFPRSDENIRALALHRGATAHCNYAESFNLIKQII